MAGIQIRNLSHQDETVAVAVGLIWTATDQSGPCENGNTSLVVTWSELNPKAKAFRVAHTTWAVVSMAGLGYIWLSAPRRRRDRDRGTAQRLYRVAAIGEC